MHLNAAYFSPMYMGFLYDCAVLNVTTLPFALCNLTYPLSNSAGLCVHTWGGGCGWYSALPPQSASV